ncbi:hypothetical protein WJX75_002111 [Coccomyxa subellipsoidea]|uniref:Poly(A) RNA polymerase mitochondrial-like central palm domain-containing protein n=1 Tax=Coccomyxa subellipsoidea TaxID=248742 RepID=A0ABR2YHS9_9CHLO
MAYPNALDEYEQGKDNLLDHLVSAQQRAEEPAPVPITAYPSGETALDSMLAACREAEDSYCSRKQWSPQVLDRFNNAFAAVIQEQTPGPQDAARRRQILEKLGGIVGAGLDGHTELRVEPYGSFVSGLYSPTGDLDISIEGNCGKEGRGRQTRDLGKTAKAAMLRALSKKLERSRLHRGYIQRILHARVPILKFVWAETGIPCDVSVGSSNSRFKAEVVKALAEVDFRFAQMLRVIKVWSAAHGLNDASNGTFNTFALSLMVLFHLQMRRPAVLPPLHELFRDSSDAFASRPLHMGQDIRPGVLEAFQAAAEATPRSGNSESLAELLASFFARFAAATQRWLNLRECCDVRASTWCGSWSYRPWGKAYMAAVEDPFDCTDNCARTIGRERLPYIARSFAAAADAMMSARDPKGVESALAWLFGGGSPANMPKALRPQADSVGRNGKSEHKRRDEIENGRTWRQMNGGKEGGALPNGTPHETRSTSSLPNGANSRELHGSAAEALERLKTATFQEQSVSSNSSSPRVAKPRARPLVGPVQGGSPQAPVPKFVRMLPGSQGSAAPQKPAYYDRASQPLPAHTSHIPAGPESSAGPGEEDKALSGVQRRIVKVKRRVAAGQLPLEYTPLPSSSSHSGNQAYDQTGSQALRQMLNIGASAPAAAANGQPSTQWPPTAQPPFGAVPSQRRKAVPVQEQPGHQHGGGPASQAQYSPLLPDFELSSRASPAGGPGTQLQYSPIPPDPPQVHRQGGDRKSAAAVQSAAAAGPSGSGASAASDGKEAAKKKKCQRNYRPRKPDNPRAGNGLNSQSDGTTAASGPPRVVEVPRRNAGSRKDSRAAAA